MEQKTSIFKDRLFFSFLLLLVWIPIPLGSNRVFAWSMMEIAIFIISITWLWQFRLGKREIPPAFKKAWPALLILGLWLSFIGFQILPLPHQWIATISSESAAMHALVAEANNEPLTRWVTISVAPDITAQALLKSVAYVLFFSLTLLLVKNRTELKWLGYALVISGVLQALYGIFMVLSGLEYGFLMEKVAFRHVVTGTFISRNNLANFLTLCMSIGIGLLLAQLNEGSNRSWRAILRSTLDWLLSSKMRLRFFLIIMAIALVMTHSRMGNVSFFISLLIAGLVAILLSKRSSRPAVVLLSSLVILDLFVIGSMVGMDRVVERIGQSSVEREHRDEVAVDTLKYWDDYRWTGSGLGDYYTTYPRYRSEVVSGFYNHAHNDYLELAAETGIIGIALLGLFVILTLWAVLRVLWQRHDPWCRGFSFSIIMSICAMLIHGTVDFNLQIPANSVYFMVILALGWISFGLPSTGVAYSLAGGSCNNGRTNKRSWVAAFALVLSILILKVLMWCGADLLTSTSNYRINQWAQKGKIDVSELKQRLDMQKIAINLAPSNFYSHYTMGRLVFLQSKVEISNKKGRIEPTTQQDIYDQMHEQFKQATLDAPVNPNGWLLRAASLYYKQDFSDEFQDSLHNAKNLGTWELAIQGGIITIGENSWDQLTHRSKETVLQSIENNFRKYPATTPALLNNSPLKETFCQRLKLGGTDPGIFCRDRKESGK